MHKVTLLLSILMASVTLKAQVPTYTITIKITNVKNDHGNLLLALFNSSEAFEKDERLDGKGQKAQAGNLTVIWEDVPAGTYAFKIFHDENENNSIDVNFFGIPSEGYAFSNNAKGAFGPPDYEAAKFTLNQNIIQTIKLNY